MWNAHSNGVGYVAITIKVNGTLHSTTRLPAVTGKDITNTLSVDIKLNLNDKVTVLGFQSSGVAQSINQDPRLTKFSGHLIYRQ